MDKEMLNLYLVSAWKLGCDGYLCLPAVLVAMRFAEYGDAGLA